MLNFKPSIEIDTVNFCTCNENGTRSNVLQHIFQKVEQVHFDYNNINISNEVVYLGATLDRELLFKNHIEKSCQKALHDFRALWSFLHRRSSLNKLDQYCLSHLKFVIVRLKNIYERSRSFKTSVKMIYNKDLSPD